MGRFYGARSALIETSALDLDDASERFELHLALRVKLEAHLLGEHLPAGGWGGALNMSKYYKQIKYYLNMTK